MQVLILDCNYLPLNIVRYKKAIGYLVTDKAECVAWRELKGRQVPSVVRFKYPINTRSGTPKINIRNLLLRDDCQCQLQLPGCQCTAKGSLKYGLATMDHLKPKALGGKHNWNNIISACYFCNNKKGTRLIGAMKAPYEPSWRSLFYKNILYNIAIEEWKAWIPMRQDRN